MKWSKPGVSYLLLDMANRVIPKQKQERKTQSHAWIDGPTIILANKEESTRNKAKRSGLQRHCEIYEQYTQRLQSTREWSI